MRQKLAWYENSHDTTFNVISAVLLLLLIVLFLLLLMLKMKLLNLLKCTLFSEICLIVQSR